MNAVRNAKMGVVILLSVLLSGCSVTLFGEDCDKIPPGPEVTTSTGSTAVTTFETGETATITTTDDCPDDGEIAPNDWMMVSSGSIHSCAVDTDGMISCWGETTSYADRPTGYDGYWTSVHTGSTFTCGTESRADGADYIKCWGDISQAGIDGLYESDNVSVGMNHLCFVDSESLVVCSGDNTFGQSTPPKGLTAALVVAGPTASCALDAKAATIGCWGSVGDETKTKTTTTTTTKTTTVSTLAIKGKGFSAMAVGETELCAVGVDGAVSCYDLVSGASVATGVSENKGWASVTLGMELGCVFDGNYNSTCWTGKKELTFTAAHDVVEISAGSGFVCAVEDVWGVSGSSTSGGKTEETGTELVLLGNDLVCWGESESGAACPP